MNGFIVSDTPLKVGNVPFSHSMYVGSTVNMDDEQGGFLSTTESRTLLMHKLAGGAPSAAHRELTGIEALVSGRNNISSVATQYLIISNLISSENLELIGDQKYYNEIHEDVKAECSNYGAVENVIIDVNASGDIWVKMVSVQDAKSVCTNFNTKNYRGRQILCAFAKEEAYLRRTYPLQ